jgi:hypothetical protein
MLAFNERGPLERVEVCELSSDFRASSSCGQRAGTAPISVKPNPSARTGTTPIDKLYVVITRPFS